MKLITLLEGGRPRPRATPWSRLFRARADPENHMKNWRSWFSHTLDEDIREELQDHLARRTEHHTTAGMPPQQAEAAARRRLGNTLAIQEDTRAVHTTLFIDQALADLRHALRAFRRNPVFALTAIAALALGIGPAAAVFSVVDRILFRPLPYPHQDRLVSFGMKAPIESLEFLLAPNYIDVRRRETPLEAVTSWTGTTDCDLTEGQPLRMTCAKVESSFLDTFGITPLHGRMFTRDEDRPNAPRVALLSYALWQSRFASDPAVVTKTVSIDGAAVRILGVLPQHFEMPSLNEVDLLIPQQLNEAAPRNQGTMILRSYGRLKPGVTVEQAVAGLAPWFQDAMKDVPPQFRKEVSLRLRSLRDRQVGDSMLPARLLLFAVLLVLLLACANVANLLIARALSSQRELAIRSALGASRWRMLRHSLVESLLLSLCGALTGLALAALLLRIFTAAAPGGIPRLADASLDPRVLLFSVAAALASGVLFAVLPQRSSPSAGPLTGTRSTRPSRGLLRIGLVSLQLAISVILLDGAALLLRSFWNIQNSPLGFTSEGLITAQLVLGQQRYGQPPARVAFFESLEERLSHMPGIAAWAVSDSLPPSGMMRSMVYAAIDVEGRPPFPEGTGGMVAWRAVTPGYFRTLSIPIERGRGFTESDRQNGQDSVILSRMLARRVFGEQDPLGHKMRFGRAGSWYTVIGIVADARNAGLTQTPDPEYYMVRKHPDALAATNLGLSEMQRRAYVSLRTQLNPEQTERWLQSEIASLDPALPLHIETMPQRLGQLAARPRFLAWLVSLFAVAGLLLASVGLYGVMSYLVSGRSQEIGVRMALGATPAVITAMILTQAGRWTLAGAAAGLAGTWIAVQYVHSLFHQVSRHDPLSLFLALAILIAVALLAAYAPSRRAARIDPIQALRQD